MLRIFFIFFTKAKCKWKGKISRILRRTKKHRYISSQLRSGIFVSAIACKLQTKGVYSGEKSAIYLFLLHHSIKNALCFVQKISVTNRNQRVRLFFSALWVDYSLSASEWGKKLLPFTIDNYYIIRKTIFKIKVFFFYIFFFSVILISYFLKPFQATFEAFYFFL